MTEFQAGFDSKVPKDAVKMRILSSLELSPSSWLSLDSLRKNNFNFYSEGRIKDNNVKNWVDG